MKVLFQDSSVLVLNKIKDLLLEAGFGARGTLQSDRTQFFLCLCKNLLMQVISPSRIVQLLSGCSKAVVTFVTLKGKERIYMHSTDSRIHTVTAVKQPELLS